MFRGILSLNFEKSYDFSTLAIIKKHHYVNVIQAMCLLRSNYKMFVLLFRSKSRFRIFANYAIFQKCYMLLFEYFEKFLVYKICGLSEFQPLRIIFNFWEKVCYSTAENSCIFLASIDFVGTKSDISRIWQDNGFVIW